MCLKVFLCFSLVQIVVEITYLVYLAPPLIYFFKFEKKNIEGVSLVFIFILSPQSSEGRDRAHPSARLSWNLDMDM